MPRVEFALAVISSMCLYQLKLRRNVKNAPKLVKEKIYQTLIRPQLEYASSAWSPWLKQDILELEKVQYRAARFVDNNYWPLASASQMISTLDWETLEAYCQKAHLIMLFKAINSLTNIPMDHYGYNISTTISFHGQNILSPFCRTDTYKHSFFLSRSASETAYLDKPSTQHPYAPSERLYRTTITTDYIVRLQII